MTGTKGKRIPCRRRFMPTLTSRATACSLVSFIATAQFIAVANSKPLTNPRHTPSVRRHSADKRRLAAKQDLFRPLNRSHHEKPAGAGDFLGSPAPPARHHFGFNARQPFRRRKRTRHHPSMLERNRHCPATLPLRSRGLLLRPLSQRKAFEPPR